MTSALLLACLLVNLSAAPIQSPGRVPALKRLSVDYLKQAHMDVEALAKARQPVSLKTGYNDYRCVIHAHSYLSHDSRGTIEEIASAAKSVRVDAVFLTNHPKKDVDVVAAGQKEPVGGVLFFPGVETNGFLAFPGDVKLPPLDVDEQAFVDSIRASYGLVFVAHPEEHKDWSLKGLTGTEIYNTHADFSDESELLAALQPKDSKGFLKLLGILNSIKAYPQEGFACITDAPTANLSRYDSLAGPCAAIAGNDSHQNTGFVLRGGDDGIIHVEGLLGERLGEIDTKKVPIAKTLFGEPIPGKELMRRVLDPYPVSFRYVSTHVLARERTPAALKRAFQEARTYVAFDWIADPTGAAFVAESGGKIWTIGDSLPLSTRPRLKVELPLPASIRLLRNGAPVATAEGRVLEYDPIEAGAYHVEAALVVAGESRPWIYTGAIRIQAR